MPAHPNRLTRFWQELKRRRVVHVITVYASSSFVIIELINNLAEPLHFPPNLLTIVVIVLAVGFPPAAILSWLYDLTGRGMERTKPLSEAEEGEKTVVPNAWRIATYVSFIVIVGLVSFNIIGGTKALRAGDIESLLILPFDNFTGDNQLDYVAAGMHSALIGDMGRISALRVISKTTAAAYKKMDLSLPQIAKEINMEAVVEPSVLCYGDSVCVQIRVIKMYPKEKQLWVAEYKEDKSQILNLYSKITKQIADDLKLELTPEEKRVLAKSRTVDRRAYDAYLMGLYYLDDASQESLYKARDYLNHAVDEDPEWAPLYTGLTMVWASIVQMGFESPEIAGPKIFENLNKALELDPDNAESHFISGEMAFLAEWDWEKGEKELLKSLAINPSDAIARVIYAQLLSMLQRPDEARIQGKLGINLDPLNPMIQLQYSGALMCIGDCENALAYAEIVTSEDPGNYLANSLIENEAFRCGDYDKVMKAAKNIVPSRGVAFQEVERIYEERGFVSAYEEILRQLEEIAKSEYIDPVEMAVRYIMVNQPDKAMDWIEKGFEIRSQSMPYIATHSLLCEPLFDNPRFIDILHKMNLPLPNTD